jgi:hypothetical protein
MRGDYVIEEYLLFYKLPVKVFKIIFLYKFQSLKNHKGN